jgi:hypothetical protein
MKNTIPVLKMPQISVLTVGYEMGNPHAFLSHGMVHPLLTPLGL